MRTRIKICGITRLEDALAAVALGVDALGFNFWAQSKRHVAPDVAGQIVRRLPPFVTTVGVFVNAMRFEIFNVAGEARMQAIQLHGDEPVGECSQYSFPVLYRLRAGEAWDEAALARSQATAFLLDTPSPAQGGAGVPFDWSLARPEIAGKPVILAGGLTPENVGEAVRRVRPYGVDVASGVESSPGVKDHEKLARFVEAVRRADAEEER
ncbi:phosphoribosylanthranilate isomerase [Anaeromyxobacter paludicola]|uniref:N-(5'-phosphoribosyl)anthranilate isomerase n=1 Tax=Anaeromyxobacter paludicola TaxID=2918171 RepID=A0ABM7XC11_9BACT|nr:phosphoribosylanthranilate isomerase [Anaeromyxobacter paludicola]BDG09388.1 N-(5'-phosphoribosyl)anthranilate isomerase [Anaeromyxobacter paludicola]